MTQDVDALENILAQLRAILLSMEASGSAAERGERSVDPLDQWNILSADKEALEYGLYVPHALSLLQLFYEAGPCRPARINVYCSPHRVRLQTSKRRELRSL